MALNIVQWKWSTPNALYRSKQEGHESINRQLKPITSVKDVQGQVGWWGQNNNSIYNSWWSPAAVCVRQQCGRSRTSFPGRPLCHPLCGRTLAVGSVLDTYCTGTVFYTGQFRKYFFSSYAIKMCLKTKSKRIFFFLCSKCFAQKLKYIKKLNIFSYTIDK